MKQKFLLEAVALAVVLLLVAPTAFAGSSCQPGSGPSPMQCLVTNGSFETGDFTGWTLAGNTGFTGVTSGAFYPVSGAEDGQFFAYLGPIGSDGSLSQTIATMPGAQYCLSFWFAAAGDNPSDFSANWDGTPVYSVINPNTGGVWTHYTFTVTGTGSDTLAFLFRDDPAYMALDNVCVSESAGSCSSPVPESSNLAMLFGFGVFNLAAVLGVGVRRKLI